MTRQESSVRDNQLEVLAHRRFPDLADYPAERELLSKLVLGELLDKRINRENAWTSEAQNADVGPGAWGRDRTIRSKLIRWLCVEPAVRSLIDPQGIQVAGVRVADLFDLSFVNVDFPLSFIACRFTNINVANATLRTLNLASSWTGQLSAGPVFVAQMLNLFQLRADGQVNLSSAKLGGINCVGATVNMYGIFASGLRVDGNATFGGFGTSTVAMPLRVQGPLVLYGSTVGGDLSIRGAELQGRDGVALNLSFARVNGILSLGTQSGPAGEGMYLAVNGGIDLRGARAGLLSVDQVYTSWPKVWYLEDFIYENIALKATAFPEDLAGGYSATASLGLVWLQSDPFHPTQPYRHFAQVLEERLGDRAGATQVREALEEILSKRDDRWLVGLLRSSIGYGYRPENAIWGLGIVTAVGWLVYWRSYRMSLMVPTDREAHQKFTAAGQCPEHYPSLSPLIYSLENTFPLVKLDQTQYWQPSPARSGRAGFLRWFRWCQVLIGWVLAGLFAAGVAKLVQRV